MCSILFPYIKFDSILIFDRFYGIIYFGYNIVYTFYIYYLYNNFFGAYMKKKILIFSLLLIATALLPSCFSDECKHFYMSQTVVDPDCDTEGKIINECIDCDFSYYSNITAPLGHTMKTVVTPATCTESGFTSYSCKCGYAYDSDFTPPNNHTFTPVVIPPKCEESGYTAYFCDCGYSYRADHTAPLNHDYTSVTKEPTCTEIGYTERSCKLCESQYTDEIKEPLGHKFTAEVFRPTCISGGHTLNTCENCGYSYKADYVFYSDIIESAFEENTQVLAKGLDVSKWNHSLSGSEYLPLDWNLIKSAGFDFVILKAGSSVREDGKGGIEPTFEADYKAARAAGLDVGVYFYSYAHSVDEIKADVQSLLIYIEGKQFEYPIYLDMEEATQETLGKDLLGKMYTEFSSILQAEGYYTGIYLNNNWLKYVLDRVEVTTLFDLWYARYPTGSDLPVWNEESYGKQLGMWQFTESGIIEGINAKFDFDYAYRDYPSLMKQWHLNGY